MKSPMLAHAVIWGMALASVALVFIVDDPHERILCGLCALFFLVCIVLYHVRGGKLSLEEREIYEIPASVELGDAETAIRELVEMREHSEEWFYALAERVEGACYHGHPELAHALLDHFGVSVDALRYWAPLAPNSVEEEAELFHLQYLKDFIAERRLREAQNHAGLSQQG